MKELVIISGKGGTGKTSVTAAFAVLAEQPVIADCDVDAADLHLVLSPQIKERHEFRSGHEAVIRPNDCIACGVCFENCRFRAIMQLHAAGEWVTADSKQSDCNDCDYCERSCSVRTNAMIREIRKSLGESKSPFYIIDPVACEGCGVCVRFCPEKAIDFPERLCGEWMISDTRCGPMVHARLGIAAENSGKLVSLVRREARRIAEEQNRPLVIVDGPPGIGCPVIASVTGASLVLVVTEPTVSGEHDLERVLSLARHFKIPALICVNKWDINPDMTAQIEQKALLDGAHIAGRIPWDRSVTAAQMAQCSVVEYSESPAAQSIKAIWQNTLAVLQ